MNRITPQRGRRGSMLVYSLYLAMVMCTMISLAVDYGRMQLVKTEMQRSADATARGALERYVHARGTSSDSTSFEDTQSWLKTNIANKNPIDADSGITPTVTAKWGYWDTAGNAFHQQAGFVANPASSPTHILAIEVIVSCSTANNNAIPLAFPLFSGKGLITRTCDVWAKSVAALPNPVSINFTAQSTSDPWLSGMPAGSNASYDDTAPNESPTAISVTPGSVLTFTSVTGDVLHMPGAATDGPDGNLSQVYWHMKDPPGAGPDGIGVEPQGGGMENNIGDITTPIDSLIGVFLNNNVPTSNPAPTVVRNYTTDMGQTGIDDLQLQQPFYVGDGTTSSSTTQTWVVPSGATRLYMGQMDGYEWSNNVGSFSGTITEQPPIEIVQ